MALAARETLTVGLALPGSAAEADIFVRSRRGDD